jgi:hypothetical protein
MESKDKSKNTPADRVTISLVPGRREFLEEIAQSNNAPISFVVRYALNEFFDKYKRERNMANCKAKRTSGGI